MDRADFQQQIDLEEREALAMQALMDISAAGFTRQADILASECGLAAIWKTPIRTRNTDHIQFP